MAICIQRSPDDMFLLGKRLQLLPLHPMDNLRRKSDLLDLDCFRPGPMLQQKPSQYQCSAPVMLLGALSAAQPSCSGASSGASPDNSNLMLRTLPTLSAVSRPGDDCSADPHYHKL